MNEHTTDYTPTKALEALVLSQNPGKAMQEMMDTIKELHEVYVEETQALEDADTKTFMALQALKLQKATCYEEGITQMLSRKGEFKDADPELKKKIEKMQKDFSELATKNKEALERMKRCTQRLGNTISNAARDSAKKQNVFSYGEDGAIKDGDTKSVSMGVSETA